MLSENGVDVKRFEAMLLTCKPELLLAVWVTLDSTHQGHKLNNDCMQQLMMISTVGPTFVVPVCTKLPSVTNPGTTLSRVPLP